MIEAIFIDDGGVMNDNAARGPQWQRLVGEFCSAKLGGDRDAWERANVVVFERQLERLESGTLLERDYIEAWREEGIRWLREMCELVGVDAPAEDQECHDLSRAGSAFVTRRVKSAYPGVIEAIRSLYGRGYVLYTASAEGSNELDGYLRGMQVRPLFDRLYGPDLVNTWKGPLYYERIFADAGIEPPNALVVDDSPKAVGWAADAGARTVLISREVPGEPTAGAVLGSLEALHSYLDEQTWAVPAARLGEAD